jgi:protein TonB
MFEQSILKRKSNPWAVMISFAVQSLILVIMILIPLLNYYDIPVTTLSTFLVAPPPPPPPPPPVEVKQRVIPKQFVATELTQPKAIPDKIAIIQDDQPRGLAGVAGGVGLGSAGGILNSIIATPTAAPPPPPPPPPPPAPKRITVGGAVQQARMLRRVNPVYPPLAKSARIQGTVQLSAVIGKDGNIQELEVIEGHPMLIQAAMAAVQQWQYKPTLLNGQPVEVATQINVVFTLGN